MAGVRGQHEPAVARHDAHRLDAHGVAADQVHGDGAAGEMFARRRLEARDRGEAAPALRFMVPGRTTMISSGGLDCASSE